MLLPVRYFLSVHTVTYSNQKIIGWSPKLNTFRYWVYQSILSLPWHVKFYFCMSSSKLCFIFPQRPGTVSSHLQLSLDSKSEFSLFDLKLAWMWRNKSRVCTVYVKTKLAPYYSLSEEKGSVQRSHYSCIEFMLRLKFLVWNVVKVNIVATY